MIETIITASLLIAIVLGLRFIFKKTVSRRYIYALWAVVALRLLIPFSLFASPISVMNIVPQQSKVIFYNDPKKALAPTTTPNIAKPTTPTDITATAAPTVIIPIDMTIVVAIWLLGVLTLALCFVFTNIKFFARLLANRQRLTGFDELKLAIYLSDAVTSPCLYGIIKPCIYLTPQSLDNADLIIKHELAHYKQKDHLWALIRCACLCLHWFNPLVWIGASVSRSDGEIACDERTIKVIGEDKRHDYGKLLISMATVKSGKTLCLATSLAWSKSELTQRIKHIAKHRKTFVAAVATLVALAVIATILTFGSAYVSKNGEKKGIDQNAINTASAHSFLLRVFDISEGTRIQFLTNNHRSTEEANKHFTQVMADICGDEVDPLQLTTNAASLYNNVSQLFRYSPHDNIDHIEIHGVGDTLDFVVYTQTSSGVDTRVEAVYNGLVQFNSNNKINFFKYKFIGSEIATPTTLWESIKSSYSSKVNLEDLTHAPLTDKALPIDPSTLLVFEDDLTFKSTQSSSSTLQVNLSCLQSTTVKYRDKNNQGDLRKNAVILLAMCDDFDKIVFNINNIHYEFTREWAEAVLGVELNSILDSEETLTSAISTVVAAK